MNDVILHICDHLSSVDKLRLLSTKTKFHHLKVHVSFALKTFASFVHELFYYDRFERIVSNGKYDIPKYAKHIVFTDQISESSTWPNTVRSIRLGPHAQIDGIVTLPPNIKRLSLCYESHSINNFTLDHVEHITYHYIDCKYIEELNIPLHITSLKLYHLLQEEFKTLIPTTVTRLCLDDWNGFGEYHKIVPDTVTHFKVYVSHLNLDVYEIPIGVTHFLLVDDYNSADKMTDAHLQHIPEKIVEFVILDKKRNVFMNIRQN